MIYQHLRVGALRMVVEALLEGVPGKEERGGLELFV